MYKPALDLRLIEAVNLKWVFLDCSAPKMV